MLTNIERSQDIFDIWYWGLILSFFSIEITFLCLQMLDIFHVWYWTGDIKLFYEITLFVFTKYWKKSGYILVWKECTGVVKEGIFSGLLKTLK